MRPARVCFSGFLSWTGYRIYHFCLNQGNDLSIFVLNWVKCLKQGIKNRNSVLKWVGKLAIFVLNRVRVWGAAPYLPTQGYVEYPPPPPGIGKCVRNPLAWTGARTGCFWLLVIDFCSSYIVNNLCPTYLTELLLPFLFSERTNYSLRTASNYSPPPLNCGMISV